MLLDTRTFGKKVARELLLKEMDLKPCPFTITTSLGFTEHARTLTKEPICLEFKVGHNDVTHLNLKCVVIGAKIYDITFNQQALYPNWFGHDNWIEEAWLQPRWALGDGRKEMFHVSFSNLTMVVNGIKGLGAMYGRVGLVNKLPIGNDFLEGNM
jgi:hypothetical protein